MFIWKRFSKFQTIWISKEMYALQHLMLPLFIEEVRVGDYTPAVGTYTMSFNVSDQCGNQNNGVLTIYVLNWVRTKRDNTNNDSIVYAIGPLIKNATFSMSSLNKIWVDKEMI